MAKRKMGRPKGLVITKQVGIILPEDLCAEVQTRAAKEGLTRAGWIRRAVYRELAADDTRAA